MSDARHMGHVSGRAVWRCLAAWCLAAVATALTPATSAEPARVALNAQQHDSLSAAQRLLEAGADAQSLAEIEALLPTVQDQPYALAIAQLVLAQAQRRGGDLHSAEQAMRQAIDAGILPSAVRRDAEYQLIEVLAEQGRDGEALRLIAVWLNGERQPSVNARRLAALLYVRNGRCDLALPQLQALKHAGVALESAWASALITCQGELKHRGQTTALVAELLRDHPADKRAWLQAVTMYRDAGQMHEAMALLELLATREQLDGNELRELARMYMTAGTPLRAAQWLERGLASGSLPAMRSNLELLAQAWRAGLEYERALAIYRRIVAERADGNLYFAIGALAFDLRRWSEAVEALRLALAQPVLKQSASAHLLLGIAAWHSADHELANNALHRARRMRDTEKVAQWWLDEIARTQARAKAG